MAKKVYLSQCMIVKNEEDNIERALSWGKGIVKEQIVVDTGSTDRTVELAEKMGARVYHFEWTDDFSAAKNFAISKARGNWIVFLDADEYLRPDDRKKLINILEILENKPEMRKIGALQFKLVNLETDGSVISTTVQVRAFRKNKDIRYEGKIHEALKFPDFIQYNCEYHVTVLHTGYASQYIKEKKKGDRNVKLLERRIQEEADNYELLVYYGDSLGLQGNEAKAEEVYWKAFEHIDKIERAFFRAKILYQCMCYMVIKENTEDDEKFRKMYQQALELLPGYPDTDFLMGMWETLQGHWNEALALFEEAQRKHNANEYNNLMESYMDIHMRKMYKGALKCAIEIGDKAQIVKYIILLLGTDKYQDEMLRNLFVLLQEDGKEKKTADGSFRIAGQLYDFNNLKDKLYVFKCAKLAGFGALEKQIVELLTPEEKEWLFK